VSIRIRSLETVPIGLPFRRPYLTATGTLERREMILVRLRGMDGATGYGDAVPMSLRGGPGLESIRADLDHVCAPALAGSRIGGDAPALAAAARERCRGAGAGAQALSAVEVAMLDLIGKIEGLPAWQLLGAAAPVPVPCNGTIGADAPEAAAAIAADMVGGGFLTLKVKAGTGADLERMRAVRAACGPDVKLRIDANAAWSVEEAVAALADLRQLGLELVEQPCRTLEELAAVRSVSGVAIVADESVDDLEGAQRAIALGAVDAVNLKLTKVGGIAAAIEIAAAVPAYLSSALDSAIGIAAAAHAAQALPARQFAAGLAHGLATSGLFTDNVADTHHLNGPSLALDDRPGLGIEVDEDAIERLRIR
jgi:L-alanine-DL-glutamate epimerase-like enolase superfamily enzyme